MNGSGCITLGAPGGPCVYIGFDIGKDRSYSVITCYKAPPDTEYMVAEAVLSRIVKGRIPGSHCTARLRKKRRKAVMAVVPKLEAMGLINTRRFSLPVSLG